MMSATSTFVSRPRRFAVACALPRKPQRDNTCQSVACPDWAGPPPTLTRWPMRCRVTPFGRVASSLDYRGRGQSEYDPR